MEILIAAIAFVALIVLGSRLTRNENPPPANTPQPDDRQLRSRQDPRLVFERLFSGYTETDRQDALRMCQKRMDISYEEAMNHLIRKPELIAEMLEYATIEAETKRRD